MVAFICRAGRQRRPEGSDHDPAWLDGPLSRLQVNLVLELQHAFVVQKCNILPMPSQGAPKQGCTFGKNWACQGCQNAEWARHAAAVLHAGRFFIATIHLIFLQQQTVHKMR